MLAGCNNHPDVKSELNCTQCHKPACKRCVVNARFCSQACSDKYQAFAKSFKKVEKPTNYSGVISTIFFLAVVAGGAYIAKVYFHLW